MPSPREFIEHLGLEPLPVEGGRFAQSMRDETASAIYYLLEAPEFSAPHRLDRVELFVHHAGAAATMLLLHPDGTVSRPVLGTDVAAGQRPQVVVPAGVWQATVTLGEWSLLGTVVVPPYTDESVEFASVAELSAWFPAAAADLRALGK
ncbi:cupin domain-containing protein [Amycolatopsis sp. H20-H5]|uniref:cupin domain-containing protein n=1 Tax=Amycolatopsis sp. H20-H5 TaxID=3046309 RepID=UPI002DBFF457|nr:cupin domain-containing protein [Amycolatopsis sp. H20-H5]MEC3976748.1 cupin domain-containing protein [Amycolatopsis sp. H20-H5]